MTAIDMGWWYGLIPPLQMRSFDVTSVMGCDHSISICDVREEKWNTNPVVVRHANTIVVPLAHTVHPELLEDSMRRRGADEQDD